MIWVNLYPKHARITKEKPAVNPDKFAGHQRKTGENGGNCLNYLMPP
jgi:hypothetical protein